MSKTRLIQGSALNAKQREHVLSAFVHRWTKENPHRTSVYRCALCDIRNPYVNEQSSNGHTHPTIPLQTDAQWLADHAFYVKANGDIADKPGHCEPAYMADVA